MCGLVGVFGTPNVKMEDVFTDLLQFDVVRGPHSTGVALADMNRKVVIHKDTALPQELMGQHKFRSGMQRRNSLLMGHNRFATVGRINEDNAHPFHFKGDKGNIIGAHNGTLKNKWELETPGTRFDTDSQALFNHMSSKGLKKTWESMSGAAAVSVYEVNHHNLTLATNGQRPLHYTILNNKRHVIWASEAWMIRAACWRRGVEIGKVIEIESNKGVLFWLKGDVIKHQVFKLKPRPKPQAPYYGTGFHGRGQANGQESKQSVRWIEWDTHHKQWVQKIQRKGYTSVILLGRDLKKADSQAPMRVEDLFPEIEKELDGLAFRPGVDKRDLSYLKDQWGYYSSCAFTKESYKEHFTSCRICKDDISEEHNLATITSTKDKEAVCWECYMQCLDSNFDPGAPIT